MYVNPFLATYANDNDALIPELWARESIAVLFENMVVSRLVHRDFENEIASFGDVVNTRKPADRVARRKTDADNVVFNDAIVNNVQVPLNQHIYEGFTIKDGERSKSMQDLVEIHLVPSMKAVGNMLDRAVTGRMAHSFLGGINDRAGRLLNLDNTTAKDGLLEASEILNNQLAPVAGRRLVVAPAAQTAILGTELFVRANERGDGGTALEQAVMGSIYGFDTFMSQNVNFVRDNAAARDTVSSVTSAAIAQGATGSLTAIDFTGYVVSQGEFVILAGNDQPTWATAVTSSMGDTTAVTLNEELKFAVANGAAITAYSPAAADGSYAAGYANAVVLDGHTANKNLIEGQIVAFGNTVGTRHTYTVVEVESTTSTSTTVYLDRPLDAAVADNDAAYPGPAGSFNPAFTRNAVALVVRPLALPDPGDGARSFVANFNDLSMRATMQYDITSQGTRVVLDLLAGVAVLDNQLGTILLG